MSNKVQKIKNLRTVKALRGQALSIDMGTTLSGTLTAWMKKKPTDTTFRSFEVVDNRYLVLSKLKASDYYDINTGDLIESIKGKWYFDIRNTPVGGTSEDEVIIYSGTIYFDNQITDSNGVELIDPASSSILNRFIQLDDTPNSFGSPGEILQVNSSGTALEFTQFIQDKHYTHDQGIPSQVWTINHSLNKYPSIVAVDTAKSVVVGQINYIDLNNITITFNSSFSGEAYLN